MSSEGTLLAGIFIGGRAVRMAGRAKGLLKTPSSNENLVERLRRITSEALPGTPLVLVGQHSAYEHLELEQLADAPEAQGPRAGLLALCRSAERRGRRQVLALACDLPYLSASLLGRLAGHAPEAAAVAPLIDERYQPFCARYDAELTRRCILADRQHPDGGLQAVLRQLGATTLPLDAGAASELRDWDTPEDIES